MSQSDAQGKTGYFYCSKGHIYPFGNEAWHFEQSQRIEGGVPIPRQCQHETNSGSCRDSSTIIGPFSSTEAARMDHRDWLVRNRPATSIDDTFAVYSMARRNTYKVGDFSTAEKAVDEAAHMNSQGGPSRHYAAVRISFEVLS